MPNCKYEWEHFASTGYTWPSARHCGGTVWAPIPSIDWDRYCAGRIVPYPRDAAWCVSPTHQPVICQHSSVEMSLCLCANYGQRARLANLLAHPHLDWDDIHPGARADAHLYLRDREGLLSVLERSALARAYVMNLRPHHFDPELMEWAHAKCEVLLARDAAWAAMDEVDASSDECELDDELQLEGSP